MTRAKRTDANQNAIVSMFRQLGWSVAITSALGGGFPDIVIGKNRISMIIEIKDGDKPPSARKLTEAEQKFKDVWRGQYDIVETMDDVLRINEAQLRKV